MIVFEIKKELAEISSNASSAKKLTLTSWNKGPAKLDFRIWLTDYDEPKPGKGMTLTDEEAQTLADAINAYLQAKKDGKA